MSATALLIIDVQLALVSGAFREREVLSTIADLARRARAAGAPVIYMQHCHDRFRPMMKSEDGWQIHPVVVPAASDIVVEKTASIKRDWTPNWSSSGSGAW